MTWPTSAASNAFVSVRSACVRPWTLPVTITSVGQPALFELNATAGPSVSLSVTANTISGVNIFVVDPLSGLLATVLPPLGDSTSSAFTLTATGTYTIEIIGPTAGSLTFTLVQN